MKETWMCLPKICHFGIRIILSWRHLRNCRSEGCGVGGGGEALCPPIWAKSRIISICRSVCLFHTRQLLRFLITRDNSRLLSARDNIKSNLHKKSYKNNPHLPWVSSHIFTFPQFATSKNLSLVSCHFSANVLFFKMPYKPQVALFFLMKVG